MTEDLRNIEAEVVRSYESINRQIKKTRKKTMEFAQIITVIVADAKNKYKITIINKTFKNLYGGESYLMHCFKVRL